MTYQTATRDHATNTRQSAIGTSNSHLTIGLSVLVIFQSRVADPENDVGAEATTFSDANLLLIFSSVEYFALR